MRFLSAQFGARAAVKAARAAAAAIAVATG
jgi:hypothetical protein